MDFGRHMESLRIKAGYDTREALAKDSKISAPTIMRIEKGITKNPDIETLKKLAIFLKTPYQELLDAAGYLTSNDTIEESVKEDIVKYNIKSDINPICDAIIIYDDKGCPMKYEDLCPEQIDTIKRIAQAFIDQSNKEGKK